MITFQPAIFELAYNSNFWDEEVNPNIAPELRILRDTMYNATIAVPVMMLGVIAVWALLSVSRRED